MQQTKRKIRNKMDGRCVQGPEKDGNKRMERQSKGLRGWRCIVKEAKAHPML
jgi:hypothetical protein